MRLAPLESSVRRPANLSLHVYDAVTNGIATGGLRPGARIVVEHVARQLGVSQTPVREALGRLIIEGLVMESGSGRLQVMPLTPAYVSETFLVRGALEGLAAELAAPRIAEAQLAAFAATFDEVDLAMRQGTGDAYARFDDSFHRSIYEIAGNAVLLRELVPLQIHVDFIRHYSRGHPGEHISLSHAEHRAIIEALCSRDARRSRKAMETHIRNAGLRIERLIDFDSRECRGAFSEHETGGGDDARSARPT
jgi:DNA-binding GntR family transcriptional regulator